MIVPPFHEHFGKRQKGGATDMLIVREAPGSGERANRVAALPRCRVDCG